MEIQRTANAGVLIRLDDVSILLDGVCQASNGYLATPRSIQQELLENVPDRVLFTHTHPDHYSPAYAASCGREGVLPDGREKNFSVGTVQITAIPTRHMGKADGLHQSFVLEGSKCVWFLGDASPTELKKLTRFPKPDVLIAPYAYAIGTGWKISQSLGAKIIVLLHLPAHEQDSFGLWEAVKNTVKGDRTLYIPALGQKMILDLV